MKPDVVKAGTSLPRAPPPLIVADMEPKTPSVSSCDPLQGFRFHSLGLKAKGFGAQGTGLVSFRDLGLRFAAPRFSKRTVVRPSGGICGRKMVAPC